MKGGEEDNIWCDGENLFLWYFITENISAWRWEAAAGRHSQDYRRTRSSWRPSGNPSPTRRWPSPRWWRTRSGRTMSWYSSVLAVTSSRVRRTCRTVTTPVPTVAPPCTGTDNNQESPVVRTECYVGPSQFQLLLFNIMRNLLYGYPFDNTEALLWIPIQIEVNVMWFFLIKVFMYFLKYIQYI